ncbi:E3 ubiquitin-protein ligase UBR1-like [Scleropages formosus]|uniref:E3 ubiquitin-protein ligase n=1 Tax=Scleropages formosus TaxID=113540 RepID=A0A0P7Z7F4_SCLFO|nr:E3 ubiquitin-protein ligase UBR1-like [Scleropages formosus]
MDCGRELLRYLAEQVPRIYCLEAEPCPQEEELALSLLLQPLEYFLFGEDPHVSLEKLQQSGASSQLCGRVFKEGETTYSCRLLCLDLLQMHTSSGGGFCDCGDLEAWKTGPCCIKHDQGSTSALKLDSDCALEAGLQERAQKLFRVLLQYIADMLVWEENDILPAELQPSVKEDTYYCVLYNDEHHSYDHVIYTLRRAVSCSHKEANTHTSLIDKEVALEPSPTAGRASLISRLMLHDAKLYKGARKIIHELIVCSLLMETEYKRLFAIEFTKHYKQLQKDFISDDHERSISVTALSVQIFTVPTLARQLIEEGNVIKVIIDTVMEMLSEHLDNNNRFHFQGYNSDKFFRIQVIFHDLRYILISKPMIWTNKLRTQFLEGFRTFLGMLACMQGMEEVKRQFGQHIEVEPEWEAGFSIQMQLRHILSMFQDWCASDEEVLLRAFKECHSTLMSCCNQPFHGEATDSYMCKHILHARPYRVSQEPVTVHLPVSRLLAGLYIHLCRTGAIVHLHEYVDPAHCDFAYFAEHPLRCLVLAAQVSAEMWRRNGLSLVSQVYYYQDVKCRDEMFDKDIIMLQIAASKIDPNDFVMLVLQRFELFEVFNGSCSTKDQELLKQWNRLTEEMLHLFIIIIGRKPGVSGHGLYEVKKECLQEFNPFFYHYSKSQRSKAEDAQKKRKAQEGCDKALPPPVPPPFSQAFSSIVQLLRCDVLLHVLRQVLQKAVEDTTTQWTEAMVQRAMHLAAQALLEEKTQLEANNEDDVTFDFSLKARDIGSEHGKSLFDFLSKLKGLPSLEAQKDMIQWTLQMFETVKCLRVKSSPLAATSMDQTKPEENIQDKEKAERKRKAEAAKHRQKIMAQMSAMQKNFIETHKMLYENVPESGAQGEPSAPMVSGMEMSKRRVAVGPRRGVALIEREVLTCILCQEEQEVKARAPAMVLTACVQRSTVLTQCRGKGLPKAETYNPLFMHPDLAVGTHTGSCGHVMHASCWQKYFEAVQNTSRSRLHAEPIIDLENGEYMCPLCKSLCNTVVPLIPLDPLPLHLESAELVGQLLTFPRWIEIIMARINRLKAATQASGEMRENRTIMDDELVDQSQPDFRSILSFGVEAPKKFSDSIGNMLTVCATTVYRVGLKVPPNELDSRVPIMSWNTCAFTIQAVENMLLDEDKPLFGSLQNRQLAGLKAVVQFSAAQRRKSSQAVIQNHFMGMLGALIPHMNDEDSPSVLEIDCFHLLVGLVLAIPALYQEETVDLEPSAISTAYNHLYLLHLVTMAHILQVMLSFQDTPELTGEDKGEDARLALELLKSVAQHADGFRTDAPGWYVADQVRRGIAPFLRCAALFFNCLTGISPPEELSNTPVSSDSQLEALCSYLALPSNLFSLFEAHKEVVSQLLQRWCGSPVVTKAMKGEVLVIRYPRKQNRLIDLPEDYSTLLNQACHFQCPKASDDERKHPTLCLFCGAMLCSQSTCCQEQLDGAEVGACTAHAASCGAGVGMFLRIRECEVVLMASKTRGSTYHAPYLDDYGETDPQLGRGNPLHLSPERYRKLHQLWQQHCILEEIVRSQEVVNVMFAFEWQML